MIGHARGAVPAALAVILLLAAPLHAQSLSEIRAQAQAINAEWKQMRGGGQPDAEPRLIQRLGTLVLAFIDDSDRASQSGSEQQQRGALRAAFDALYEPLDGIYKERGGRADRMAKEVMDADGDLDALYESREFQQGQAVGGQALYYLNWLNYYGARLHDGQRHKELLEAAERGFSQFAIGDRQTALIAESLLGRGMCHLDLGNYEWAIRDFRIVIDHPEASAERKAKARVALLNAYARSGNVEDTLAFSRQLLDGSGLDRRDAALVSYYRLVALFKALKGGGAQNDAYRREASALMDQLRRVSSGWAEKVDALMITQVDDPAKWVGKVESPAAKWELVKMLLQKGDEKTAQPLLEALVTGDQPAAKAYQPEAHYWLGVMAFKAGDAAAAAPHFDAAVAGKGDFVADAAYWRFKSLEALMAKASVDRGEGTPAPSAPATPVPPPYQGGGQGEVNPATPKPDSALEQRYLTAINDFLQKYPEHKSIYEARYRLGEFQQAREEFAAAIATYEQVRGDPGFELRARFGIIQSEFELFKQAADPPARDQLLARIGADFTRFDEQAQAYTKAAKHSDVPLTEFEAKLAILRAVHVALTTKDGDARIAELLADYERKFPQQHDLLAQAVRLRVDALGNLARFAEAEQEVARHSEALRAEGRKEALEKMAAGFMKTSARREVDGDAAGAKAANQVALRLFQVIEAGDGASGKTKLTLARLYEAGDPARAAQLYKEVKENDASSALAALRGLARVAEARKQLNEALDYWKQYSAAATPGDPPWYDGQYQQARVTLARGDKAGSCKILKDLRPAMPGLSDATLRQQLSELYPKACD